MALTSLRPVVQFSFALNHFFGAGVWGYHAFTDAGLGAVWCGIYPLEERVAGFRKLLGAPAHIVPFALVPIGHPAEVKPQAKRYDAARVHQDRW